MVDPVQNVGTSFYLTVEKCFICTGVDGYIPKYNPHNNEFGCIAESENLLHIFKVIDKGAPNTVHREFRNIQFNAILATDDTAPGAAALLTQPGADGFRIDSAPLFQVSYGSQWFIHCIYTVRSKENAARGIGKRSVEYHTLGNIIKRERRDVRNTYDIGNNGRGTNMHPVMLDYSALRQQPGFPDWNPNGGKVEVGTNSSVDTELYLLPTLLGLAASFLVCAVIILIVMRRRKKHSASVMSSTNTVTVVRQGKGQSKAIMPHYVYSSSSSSSEDNTEV